jgi:hypothetical protein
MKILTIRKDGGRLSRVWGFFLLEIKALFSIVFLWFANGSREAFHSHAFHAISWVLWGKLIEDTIDGKQFIYTPSFKPVWTSRERFHKVTSVGVTIAISFRSRWRPRWKEYLPEDGRYITLTNGRQIVA